MNAAIIIKKYPNRRLYDTSASRYINLEDIAGFVRDGKDVQVVDAQTGEDLTRVTLTQVIMDDAKQQPTGLPLELLRQLIVSSDRMGREFIMWYLKSAFDAYKTVQSKLHTGINEVQAAALSPISMMKSFLQGQGEKQAPSFQRKQCRASAIARAHRRTGSTHGETGSCQEACQAQSCKKAALTLPRWKQNSLNARISHLGCIVP